jgi:hypothetical protein
VGEPPLQAGDAVDDEADAAHPVELIQEHLLLGPGFLE